MDIIPLSDMPPEHGSRIGPSVEDRAIASAVLPAVENQAPWRYSPRKIVMAAEAGQGWRTSANSSCGGRCQGRSPTTWTARRRCKDIAAAIKSVCIQNI
ncbi:hypothetical protein FRACA_1090010 [Frankia canadensis]|uniref:Uncharacterized protein n=1 Tax=Frankia canadensis TaxID=1836972 RepID=A0A2I2KJ43_9ACTN|nr:hypothetical protein FRACA_1090010 [Frankia canadensis]SOU52973.1 hypothetical protein FRACA_1090010 [Frankia canadensis]